MLLKSPFARMGRLLFLYPHLAICPHLGNAHTQTIMGWNSCDPLDVAKLQLAVSMSRNGQKCQFCFSVSLLLFPTLNAN